METPGRGTNPTLTERLRNESRRFEFAAAAVLLQRLYASGPKDRPFRFRSDASLSYPTADMEIESFPESDPPEPGSVRVSFLGLTGTRGVLPHHYTELLGDRARIEDRKRTPLADYFGIFEDRVVALFLDAHLRARYWLRFAWHNGQLDPQRGHRQPLPEVILALVGTADGGMRDRAGIPPIAQIHYAGLLAKQPRCAESIRSVVADYFGVPTDVEQFHGRWVDIDEDSLSLIGARRGSVLGRDLVVGDRFFDPAARFRMRLGAMGLERLQSLLPGTEGARVLEAFVRFAVGAAADFDFTLVLKADEVPPATLTNDESAPQRLGWTLWLRSDDTPNDAVSGPFAACPVGEDRAFERTNGRN